jgi:diguanylate cyclase (GGDEF)-like protein/PAS domain S-box-containing protein
MWEVAGNDSARLQQVLQVAPAITLLLDADAIVTSVNAAFTRMLGHDQSVVVGRSLLSFIADGHDAAARDALSNLRDGQRTAVFEAHMTVLGDSARTRPVRFEIVNHLSDPVVGGIVVSGYDVTDLEAAREELEYLAQHDALTGLATRARLERHMEHLLSSEQPFAVLFIDLDRFKAVNDMWGHHTGDDVLRLVGRRLEHHTKHADLVARVGGDEFVMVAHGVTDVAAARSLAERVTAAVSVHYDVGAGPIRIGASVGVAYSAPSATTASILAAADAAMYDTKKTRSPG